MLQINILDTPLDVAACTALVTSPAAGAIDIFVGTVRNQTKGKEVIRLEFEAYIPMAIAEMQKIAEQSMERWPVQKIVFQHRVGALQVGEIAVLIAVSTPHRKASFEACQFCIDTLKETVPIWKKEIFRDGEVWVAAHP